MRLAYPTLVFFAFFTMAAPAHAGGSGPWIMAGAGIVAAAILVLAAVIRACCNKRPPM